MHIRNNQKGSMDPLMIPLIIAVVLLLAVSGFGIWSYMGYVDNRDNVAEKVDAAVIVANEAQAKELEADFIEREKKPNTTYITPAAYGSVKVEYPKTWSAYVLEDGSSSPIDGYFHPKFVPDVRSETKFALRVEIANTAYSEEVDNYDREIEKGTVKSKAQKTDGATGVRLDGEIENDVQGILVMYPIRDKTLKIWTESLDFSKDFNAVLDNLTFSL